MHEYLNFPSKNYVGKRVSKEHFIESANLTNSEKKWLFAFLEFIEVLYSFPFKDGEIVVLLASYTSSDCSQFSLNNFVTALAQSLPYKILLIVRCEGVIRFFAFDERTNVINERRSKVISVYSSRDIIPLEDDYFDNNLITSLREATCKSKSAKELHSMLLEILTEITEFGDSYILDSFKYSVEKYHEIEKKNKSFDLLTTGTFDSDVLDFNLYEGNPLDMDNVEHRFFAEFCAYYSRILYDESLVLYSPPENEWLHRYLDGCNNFSNDFFGQVLDNKSVEIITKAFWCGADEYIEAADCFNLDELKDYVGVNWYSEA